MNKTGKWLLVLLVAGIVLVCAYFIYNMNSDTPTITDGTLIKKGMSYFV